MLQLTIKAENRKLKGSVIWIACFLIPVIPAVMGTFNYYMNQEMLTGDWYSLWTQLTLFYALFFYAPLVALYCSYLWRLEHLEHNWNVLMTLPVPVRDIFFGKLYVIVKVTVITQIWLFLLFCFCGKLLSLQGLPPVAILLWALRGTAAALAIGALQLLLSMCIRSFAIPIGLALVGSIIGFLLANFSEHAAYLFPYALMLSGMNSNAYEDRLADQLIPFLASTLAFFLLFCGAGILILKRRDVKA
ncbi:MAG: ABC transporter permease [Eubacterium sp.]|nr:ABC transporter permease [Eubacterium sp.]MCM1303879.1 ABC transporter permease [Butyrivibrio sp.]MCM1344846.1 ABC transporter permease [Muribaculaceae bacterium]MCM1410811.1 ABC transporter permease [Lachnospiraceae bacterium]